MIRTRQYILALGDFGMLWASLFLMILIRFGLTYNDKIVSAHVRVFFPLFVVWILIFFIFNLYDIRAINPNPRTIGKLAMAVLVSLVASGFFFYLQPFLGISPHTNLLIVSILSFILIIFWRRLCYTLFAKVFSRKIVIVGTSAELLEMKNHIDVQVPLGHVVFHATTISEFLQKENLERIDLVINDSLSPEDMVQIEKRTDARVITLVDAYSELFAKIPLSLMTDEHALRIALRSRNYTYPLITRITEIVLSLIVLIVTSPILLIAGLAQKIEDGGEMFLRKHLRVGKNGRNFYLQKIRTMVTTAEKDGIKWTEKSDPRITRVGRIVRKLHIDEIPQLWNVVRGDMALVGPRPEQPEFVEKLEKEIPYYYLRHIIKPGFTGWAQIKFQYARTVIDSKEKLEYDLYYLENRSPLLDLGIIAKTIQIIFTH